MDKKQRLALLGLFIYWLTVNYLTMGSSLEFFPAPDDVLPIEQLEYQYNRALLPPQAGEWREISLPDDWYTNHPDQTDVWYRINASLSRGDDSVWGIYLPSVAHNAAAFVNGVWVGQGGEFSDPVSRHHNEPLLFEFSNDLLTEGNNEILIHVKSQYYAQGLLDSLYIAPSYQLYPAYAWKHFWRVSFITWVTVAMLVMACIVLAFYLVRKQDVIYGIFFIELLLWSLHNFNLFIADIPMNARYWEAFIIGTLGWTVIAMVFFNHRFVGYPVAWIERACIAIAVLGCGLFFLPSIDLVYVVGYRFWDLFLVILGIYAIFYLLYAYIKRASIDIYLMLLVGIPMLVFGFHDILLVNHYIDKSEGLIIQYSVIPAALLFSWFLLKRFVTAINHAEYLNLTLEERVENREQELSTQFEKVRALEHERVLSSERERMMRDMHDGIGGQLVALVTMLHGHSGDTFRKVQRKIEESIMDLRLVIDSLDPAIHDLATLLGMLRYRLNDQLDDSPINFYWSMSDLPPCKSVTISSTLHIARIIQEAITNSLKHSQANNLEVETGVMGVDGAEHVYIDIKDDGIGLLDSSGHGHGLKNMQYRAEKIGAQLHIGSDSQGTLVRLMLKI